MAKLKWVRKSGAKSTRLRTDIWLSSKRQRELYYFIHYSYNKYLYRKLV